MPDDIAAVAAARVSPDLLAAWFKLPLRPAAVLMPLSSLTVITLSYRARTFAPAVQRPREAVSP